MNAYEFTVRGVMVSTTQVVAMVWKGGMKLYKSPSSFTGFTVVLAYLCVITQRWPAAVGDYRYFNKVARGYVAPLSSHFH